MITCSGFEQAPRKPRFQPSLSGKAGRIFLSPPKWSEMWNSGSSARGVGSALSPDLLQTLTAPRPLGGGSHGSVGPSGLFHSG